MHESKFNELLGVFEILYFIDVIFRTVFVDEPI